MQNATTTLAIIRERGKRGLPLERVYKYLFNKDLYLMAYGKIYRNKGAMTPGSTPETVDEMSQAKIDTMIEAIRNETYRWTPTRRIYIEKKNSTKKRPLSLPSWSDKLVQEVIRLLLESYFEPQFSDLSHGFRPGRGCHSALHEVDKWLGTTWFIEGDIKGCFDHLDHELLLETVTESIHDGRFKNLLKYCLKAGYLEAWKYHTTFSGAPQGGVVSPILANIYLDKLDKYVERVLMPKYTKGTYRRNNPAYERLKSSMIKRRQSGAKREARRLRRAMQQLPSRDPNDPGFRRLRYVRYADDWLIGFIGPRNEAEEIKQQMKSFLKEELKLELSEEKTLITHAKTDAARFLGYDISTMKEDTYRTKKKRQVNGKIKLSVPGDILKKKCQKYMEKGKPIDRRELESETVFSIIAKYQYEYRGLVEYYLLANDVYKLNRLKGIMQQSLVKTLSRKLKLSVTQVYEKYGITWTINKKQYKGLQEAIQRDGKKPLVARWGGIPLRRKVYAILNDNPKILGAGRSELEKRMMAHICELCGSTHQVEVHHIRALKDLKVKGQREKPNWIKVMASRQRKTLVVCRSCHMAIHTGKLKSRT